MTRLSIWTLKPYPHRRVPIIPEAATQSESFRWKHPFSLRAVLGTQVNSKFCNASFALKEKKKKKPSLNINPQISNLCLNQVPICSPTKILGEVLSPHSGTLVQQCGKKKSSFGQCIFQTFPSIIDLFSPVPFLLLLFPYHSFRLLRAKYWWEWMVLVDGELMHP